MKSERKDKKRITPRAVESKKETLPSWRVLDLKTKRGASLETSHRLSWRRYAVHVSLVLSFTFSCGNVFAETKAAMPSSSESGLLSKEGQKQTLEKKRKEAAKKIVKTGKLALPEVSKEDEEAEGKLMSVKGTVSARNNYGIAVEYGIDPDRGTLEMWAALNSKTKLSGVSKMSEFQEGDTVELRYKELKGGKKIFSSVALLQKKPKEEPQALEPAVVPAKAAETAGLTVKP